MGTAIFFIVRLEIQLLIFHGDFGSISSIILPFSKLCSLYAPANCFSSQSNNVSKHRNELFSKETLTNSFTVCHIVTLNMLKTSKLGLISWTKDK